MKSLETVLSPCIGVCSTTYGDDVCRGCKRRFDDVTDWNGYDDGKKITVYRYLEQQMLIVVEPMITITDEALLKQALDEYQIRYQFYQQPKCWAYLLLRTASFSKGQLPALGIELKVNSEGLASTIDHLDQAFFEASLAAAQV